MNSTSPIRIAIVCGHFLPELGYIEVDLAKTLARMGHHVEVVTSDTIPRYIRSKVGGEVHVGTCDQDGYRIHRLKARMALGQVVVSDGIRKKVKEISPALVIVIGLGKRFPLPILQKKRPWRLTVLLGDNHAGYARQRRLADRLLKDRVYRKAVDTSDTLLSYTPESKEIVRGLLNKELRSHLEKKCHEISLGYDAAHFRFIPELREEMRAAHGLGESDMAAVTATRCSPEKKLDDLLKKIDSEIGAGSLHSYHLIGLAKDETSSSLRTLHGSLRHADRIHLHEMMDQDGLLRYYHLADIGIWTRAAISIFQALGAGLPLILPRAKSVDHVLEDGQGTRAEIEEIDLEKALIAVDRDHGEIARSAAARFSNEYVASEVLRLSAVSRPQ